MNGANCKAIEKRRCTVPINYVQLGALSELPLVERAIATLKAQMEHAEATWLRPEPIPEKPGKYILRLRPEFSEAEVRKTWSEWQAEIVRLQERRAELERELSREVSIYE